MNKKAYSLYSALFLVLAFVFFLAIYVFQTVFIAQVGDEYILTPSVEIFNSTAEQLGLDATTRNTINSIKPSYDALDFPIDMGTIFILIFLVGSSLIISYKAEKISEFNFYGILTAGLLGFLFVLGLLDTVSSWVIDNLVYNFLEYDLSASAPLTYAIITNINLYAFLWALALILVNKLDFIFQRQTEENTFNQGGFEQ